MTEAKLFEQEGIVAEHIGSLFRTRERCDWVSLGIVVVRLRENMILEWVARTVFPMTRTGVLRFVSLNGGSLSTERMGHLYAV